MPGSSTSSGGRLLRMRPVKLFRESGVKDIFSVDPGLFLQAEPLPIDQIQEGAAPASGVQQLVHLICLLAVNQDRRGVCGLVPSSSSPLGQPGGFSRDTWKVGEMH